MTISEEQLQEWEVVAANSKYRFSIELAELLAQAIPALIAELREAQREAAEAQAMEKEIRSAVEFVLKAFQESEAAGYRSRDRQFCIEILSKTLEEQQDQSALTAAIDTVVAPHLQKLAELESKIDFQNRELVEKQKYILSLERNLWGAELRNAQVLSVAEKMRCAGGPQEFQYWFDELKSFLLRKRDAAIAEQEKEKSNG